MPRQTSIRELKKLINETKELTCVSVTCDAEQGLRLCALLALAEDNLNRYVIAILRADTGKIPLDGELPPAVKYFIEKRAKQGPLNITLAIPTQLLIEVKQKAKQARLSVAAFLRGELGLD
tara:strand:+ start:144 stop:506 length:363 start_codon:yes stop_codon:yes gene_type:complete